MYKYYRINISGFNIYYLAAKMLEINPKNKIIKLNPNLKYSDMSAPSPFIPVRPLCFN